MRARGDAGHRADRAVMVVGLEVRTRRPPPCAAGVVEIRRPALEHDRAGDRAAHRSAHALPADRRAGVQHDALRRVFQPSPASPRRPAPRRPAPDRRRACGAGLPRSPSRCFASCRASQARTRPRHRRPTAAAASPPARRHAARGEVVGESSQADVDHAGHAGEERRLRDLRMTPCGALLSQHGSWKIRRASSSPSAATQRTRRTSAAPPPSRKRSPRARRAR